MTARGPAARRVRALAAARGLWGLACLLHPDDVVRLAGGRPDRHSATFIKVLGARELVQAAATAAWPTAGLVRAGAAVDVVHSSSMCALAAVDRTWRRPLLLNALSSTGWALLAHRLHPATRMRTVSVSRPARSSHRTAAPLDETGRSQAHQQRDEDRRPHLDVVRRHLPPAGLSL